MKRWSGSGGGILVLLAAGLLLVLLAIFALPLNLSRVEDMRSELQTAADAAAHAGALALCSTNHALIRRARLH